MIEPLPDIARVVEWLGFAGCVAELGFADLFAIPIAMRVGRKGEENVLPHMLCQVHHLAAFEFHLAGKVVHIQRA